MINAQQFGAVGDGKTDNTQAIQRALDKAAEIKGSVFLPSGTYLCSTLVLPPNTGLTGKPNWGFRNSGGAVLQLNDPEASCLIDMTKAQGSTLNGLSLNGQKLGENIHGIMVDLDEYGGFGDEHAFRIERCRVDGFSGHGAYLNRVWCFTLRHNMFSHNAGDGVWIQGWDGFILDNWLTGNGGAGLAAREKSSSVTFTANRVEWNAGAGFEIHGGSHCNITGNYFDRQGGPGLDIKDRNGKPSSQISAVGNTFYRNGKPSCCGNQPYDSSQIRCRNSYGVEIYANICEVFKKDVNSDSSDGFSRDFGIVYGGLHTSIIKDNVMSQGARKELMVDLGGHESQVIVKDNIGSLHID
jgi:hypothetical protein